MHTSIRRGVFSAILVVLSLTTSVSFAQSAGNSVSIHGTITDVTGAIISGATLTINNPVSEFSRETTSDASGNYQFTNVPLNPYHVEVRTPGFAIHAHDPQEMTESSIARARRLDPSPQPAVASKLDALPLPNCDRDTLFLLFAAHEIRQSARRTKFFPESARVLADSGQLLLVEHIRDWRNFVAFGPGFLHLHSRAEWLRLARDADLTVECEDHVTPFVRSFLMTKATA